MRQPVVTGDEMKAIDNYTINNLAIPSLVLMERAAVSVVDEVRKRFDNNVGILVVCGSGNNGGDGIAIARILNLANYKADIMLVSDEEKMTDETKTQLLIAKNVGVQFIDKDILDGVINSYSVIIDAVFGIGLTKPIEEGYIQKIITDINKTDSYKIAVDIPSGISANTGKVMNVAVKADLTVTFGALKVGLMMHPGTQYAGEIALSDIGFPQKAIVYAKPRAFVYNDSYYKEIPKRITYSNKGTYGKVLIVAGSYNMSGASYLSAYAAYRTGSGVVRVLTVEENREIIQTSLPEAILSTYRIDKDVISKESWESIDTAVKWATVIVIGPGMSNDYKTKELLEFVLDNTQVPIIIDADALNSISDNIELLNKLDSRIIVTPHVGEMSRLTTCSINEIVDNLIERACDFSSRYGAICVLKDSRTIVTNKNGDIYVNVSGNNGMATGGTGDILTGIIAGLIAQGHKPYDAAALGTYIHGLAGDYARDKKGYYGLIARDIIEELPNIIKQ